MNIENMIEALKNDKNFKLIKKSDNIYNLSCEIEYNGRILHIDTDIITK